ncbi:hypothetical protein [Malaciobacter mytili]|uniref:hypothetical protein n=1 Tax=Malaciobacter mytili TaxID=603050 RepID=UPI003A87B874
MIDVLLKISIFTVLALSLKADVSVKVLDKKFDVAGSMLAYTEFELSGEPLAESLGLDLDTLDPNAINVPTTFDYTAGIESYEYSEEAMYAINYQSKMGPHLANGLLNKKRGADMKAFANRITSLAKATSFSLEEIPLNLHPTALAYISGYPEFAQKVDITSVNKDEVEMVYKNAKSEKVNIFFPAYLRDYKTLSWVEDKMDKFLSPSALGGTLAKDIMWAQDFLGGMHIIENDEEVEATNSKMNEDGKHALGVSSVDGFNGMLLSEIAHERVLNLQNKLAFDGKKLGVKITPQYNPKDKPIWFPHKIKVTEGEKNSVKSIKALEVIDSKSTLRDTWMLLWPMAEYYAFTDQREANQNQNLAFLAVYDGDPFDKSVKENLDFDKTNDVVAEDAFSIVNNLLGMLFKNIQALHFNDKYGTFVNTYHNGKKENKVTTYDVAYTMEALRIYQRAVDALPVGYGSSEAVQSLNTKDGKQAILLIIKQADFILKNLIGKNGLAYDTYDLKTKQTKGQSVGTQFAVLRGLTATYLVTKDEKYRKKARELYLNIEKHMFDEKTKTYADIIGKPTIYTPYTAAAVSGGLRDAILHLKNIEGEKTKTLTLNNLVKRYTTWFQTVINGPKINEGMQLAEWLGDSGENMVEGSENISNDKDNVPQITAAGGKFGTAQTMASKVEVSSK